jgi:phage protein D/phage baseplate assembly protein gpV
MPQTSRETVALYTIAVDGTELDPREADFVHEIHITDFLRLPDVCSLSVGYPAHAQGNPFRDLDSSAFRIGAGLEVRLGSTDENRTKSLFKGEIVTLEPSFETGGATLVVRAYDRSHRMLRNRRQRAFSNQTVSDVVTRICREYGLTAHTDPSGDALPHLLQNNESDWEFILRLATRVGFEFVVDDTTARFTRPGNGADEIELRYPDDLHTFRPRVTAVQQVDEVNIRGFDFKEKRQVHEMQSSPAQVTAAGIKRNDVAGKFGPTALEIAGQSFGSRSEARGIAQAMLDRLANGYLTADGSCAGDPRIKAGVKLQVSGVGSSFAGTYRVTRADHTLRGGGEYITYFSDSPGESTLGAQAASGAAGRRADSLVVGVVTSNNDPDKLGRVKVKLPALSNEESGWVPVAVPAGGKERGASMLPMPEEQVIVGFENGDPSYPYVLGSLFNGKDTPGPELAMTDGSFAVKSDKAALIAAKENVTLRSDGGKWIVQIKGGAIEETVNSGKGGLGAYTGRFDGAWKLKAGQTIQIESDMEVKISAPQIKLEASGPLQLKGNPVKIDGGAAVTVAGQVINLG